MSFMHKRCAIT